jgi:NACalpha-BTF3-like transcription factor
METYQVVGKAVLEESNSVVLEISDDDVLLVAEQSNVSKEKALYVLQKNNGDIAKSIIELKK